MTHSTDFRRRVIARMQSGNSKSTVCRLFGISRPTPHSWLNRADLSPSQNGFRRRKPNRKDLERRVADHPDALQREKPPGNQPRRGHSQGKKAPRPALF